MPAYITPGELFTGVSPGKSVTPTRLNNHVSGLTILPSFIGTQPALTHTNAVLGTDKVLVYDASANSSNGGFVSMTMEEFFQSQPANAAANIASLRTLDTTSTSAAPGDFRANNCVFTGLNQQFKHVVGSLGSGGGPTITPAAAGLGTGGSATLAAGSGDFAGRITFVTGTSAGTQALVATVTFADTFTNAPWVFLMPYGFIAWNTQSGNKALTILASTTTGFTIQSGTLAMAAAATLNYSYIVISGP